MWWTELTGRLEQATVLDPVAGAAERAVQAMLPRGPLKDVLHGRWLGHQLHPLLVALPIGMLSGATLLDLTGGVASRRAATRLVGAGVLAVAPTAAAGLADWSELGAFQRPKRVGVAHATANAVSAMLYSASWVARRRGNHARGRNLALAGAAGLSVGGYLGGHLAYSQGVGVNRNADEQRKPTEWTVAITAAELPEGARAKVDADDQQVLLVHEDGQVHGIGPRCSHYGGPLEEGELQGDCVVCPWHQSHFRLRDGSVARGPATAPQMSYSVRARDGRLEVKVRG